MWRLRGVLLDCRDARRPKYASEHSAVVDRAGANMVDVQGYPSVFRELQSQNTQPPWYDSIYW